MIDHSFAPGDGREGNLSHGLVVMSDRSALKPIADSYTAAFGQFSQQRARGLLPFRALGTIALCVDLILVIAVSVLTGIAYHLAASQTGEIETFLGVGALTAVNFSAILA